MSRAGKTGVVVGLEDLKKLFGDSAPRITQNLTRATVHGIAGRVTKGAKSRVHKDTGTLKKALKTKRRKSHPDRPVSEVHVNSGSAPDGFHWRFEEYGTGGGKGSHLNNNLQSNAHPFIGPAAEEVRADMPKIYREEYGKKLVATLKREAKKKGLL